MEQHNPNYVGGDINGGAATLRQTVLPAHAAVEPVPHRRCPASTCARPPPRPVAGCTGCAAYGAARTALADLHLPAAG